MSLSPIRQSGVLIVKLEGRLDGSNSTSVEQELRSLIEGGEQKLLLDLTSLDYVSSAGLRVFLVAAKHIRSIRGGFALCAMKDPVREIFEISGFLEMMPAFSNQSEALKSLG